MATIEQLTELQNLNECAWECTRQSRWKETTQRYLSNMLQKNLELREEVLSGEYRVSPTVDFTISERGHVRQIEAPVVRDRIVQKSLMKHVLTPSLTPCLIYDNYASMKQRGTSFARKRFEVMLHRYIQKHGTDGYILLIDVKKYFNNIDHDTLKRLIAPRLKDQPEDVMRLIHYVIDTSSKTGKGLNLGSECPQIFAIYYLNPVDQFVKVVKGVKYYGRYLEGRTESTPRGGGEETCRTAAGGEPPEDQHREVAPRLHLAANQVHRHADRTHHEGDEPQQDCTRAQTAGLLPQDARQRSDDGTADMGGLPVVARFGGARP